MSQVAEATGYTDRHIRRLACEEKIEVRQIVNWLYLVDLDGPMFYREGKAILHRRAVAREERALGVLVAPTWL